MGDILNTLLHFGSLFRGRPPVLSPTLEDLEALEFIQEPLTHVRDKFRILLHIGPIKQEDLSITVPQKGFVKIVIEHGRRQNSAGLWMKQNSTYTFELPKALHGKEFHVEWTDDNYLLIQPVTSTLISKSYSKVTRLIPQQVHRLLQPAIEINILQDMLENMELRMSLALRHLRFQHCTAPSTENIAEKPENGEDLHLKEACGLDEAHCRLARDDCPFHVPKSNEFLRDGPDGHTEISVGTCLPSRKLEIATLASNLGESREVYKEVTLLIENMDEENVANVATTYEDVICRLMSDILNQQAISGPEVELLGVTVDKNMSSSDLTAKSDECGGSGENAKLASVTPVRESTHKKEQAVSTPSRESDDKGKQPAITTPGKDSADKRKHRASPPVIDLEAEQSENAKLASVTPVRESTHKKEQAVDTPSRVSDKGKQPVITAPGKISASKELPVATPSKHSSVKLPVISTPGKDSADKRKHRASPPVIDLEAETKRDECFSPEKKLKLDD